MADVETGAAAAAPAFDEAAVRAALSEESTELIRARVEELNEQRAGDPATAGRTIPEGTVTARAIDALVAAYQEEGMTTEEAVWPPDVGAGDHEAESGTPRPASPVESDSKASPGPAQPPESDAGDEPESAMALVPLGAPESVMPSQQEYAAMWAIARQVSSTEFVPRDLRGRPDAVLAAILTGRELGIGPMQSLKDISIIDGKPALSANLMLALMRKAGVMILGSESTSEKARIHARRRDTGEEMTVEWTIEEATAVRIGKKGGGTQSLTEKDNWRNYPADMLWARTVGRLGRRLAPDILGGLGYSAEEMADFDGGWDDDPYSSALPADRRVGDEWKPPKSWREIHERLTAVLGGVKDASADEAGEWVRQAITAKYGKDLKELEPAAKEEAAKMLGTTLKTLEKLDLDLALTPNHREIVADAFKAFGATLGPQWRLGPDEPADLPDYWEATGKPRPQKPATEQTEPSSDRIEDAEWTPVKTPRDEHEVAQRQVAWGRYRAERPIEVLPDEPPDDWEIGQEYIPF